MSINFTTLGCNSTSVQATDPVTWGLISTALTFVCVLYNYGFWAKTFDQSITSGEGKPWTSKAAMFGWEIFFFHILWDAVIIGFLIWALTQYVYTNTNTSLSIKYNLLSPQDVANIFYLSIGMFMVVFYRVYQISGYNYIDESKGIVKDTTKESVRGSRSDVFFSVAFPIGMLIAICLFGGSYGFKQVGDHTYCGNAAVSWFTQSAYQYKGIGVLQVLDGVLLSSSLLLKFGSLKWQNLVSYQEKVFYAGQYRHDNKRAVLHGWLPCIHMGFWWCMAFSWFYAQSFIFTHFDLYKVIGVYFSTSFVSIALSSLSGTFDAFPAYFFCSIFVFHSIQYIAALDKPLTAGLPVGQDSIDWGLFSTGPATPADVDSTTVITFVIIGTILSVLAFLIDAAYFVRRGGSGELVSPINVEAAVRL
jgi:hypothetical protein